MTQADDKGKQPGREAPAPLPKRFYQAVSVVADLPPPSWGRAGEGGNHDGSGMLPPPSPPHVVSKTRLRHEGEGRTSAFRVLLDGKPMRTPAKAVLAVPARALAEAIAGEWAAQGAHIDPQTMPLTRLANSAIDGVRGREQLVRADIARYAAGDLVCYRAEGPEGLVRRQAEAWDAVIAWADQALGMRLQTGTGIMPVAQSPAAQGRFAEALDGFDAFELAALHVMTTLTGSALLALAHARGRLTAEAAWTAAHVDEDWQISQWGEDAEATARRDRRWAEMQSASRMLALLG